MPGEPGPTGPESSPRAGIVDSAKLAEVTGLAARRRERFAEQLVTAEARVAEADRKLANVRADLERVRRRRIVRLGAAIEAALRRGRGLVGSGRQGSAADLSGGSGSASVPVATGVVGEEPLQAIQDEPSGPGRPAIAIHIGARSRESGARWGDTAFVGSLRQEFLRRGWSATVHTADEWDSEAARRADVALHLHGSRMPPVRPGQVSLLWVISHPDRLTAARCDTYDVVFVASPRFRDLLAEVTTTPVVTLLQATDPERFHPEPGGPAHDLLFVGNSRGVRRPIIDALAGSGLDLAVYGGGWTAKLLDPARLRGEWIPNHQLRRYYASAAIVLSDHWRDMREEGFISNRVFDVLASGGFLISDRVAGLDEEFDGAVVTWAEGEDLDALAASWLARPEERRSRADRGRAIVVERHTFAQRVDVLIATATPLLEGSMVRSRADAT